MGEGYWVWLIPLATGSTSIGIVADPRIHPLSEINSFEKSLAWLHQHEPQCAQHLEPYVDKVQDFLAIRNMARGSRQVFSKDRWALVGESGVFLDPFYSPGSDFIAIGNTMVCRMIQEDLDGHPIDHLVPALQSIFLTLFHNNLVTYRDQYPLFGNPRIMAIKFVWDYAVYWGFPALLFFNNKIADVAFIQSLAPGIESIRQTNLTMQQLFRDWYTADSSSCADAAFVDQNKIELMTRLNKELREPLDDSSLRERFKANVDVIRELQSEITERVTNHLPGVTAEGILPSAHKKRLGDVFDMLNL